MRTFFQLVAAETTDDTPPEPQDNSVAAPTPTKRSLRVLCVDDDEMVLAGMRDFLVYFGHEAAIASGGRRAMEMFRTAMLKSDPYDVVITDMNMPEVDGDTVARMVKSESPDTPVMLITGAGETALENSPLSECIDIVLHKPIRMPELNSAILRMSIRRRA